MLYARPVRVEITDAMRLTAWRLAGLIEKNKHIRNGRDPNGINQPLKWFKGALGEQIMLQLFMKNNCAVTYSPRVDGLADQSDFEFVVKTGSTIKADVKFSASPRADKLLINKYQASRRHADIYIAVTYVNRSYAFVNGFTWRHIVIQDRYLKNEGFTKDRQPTYYMEYAQLIGIEGILWGANKGNATVIYPFK